MSRITLTVGLIVVTICNIGCCTCNTSGPSALRAQVVAVPVLVTAEVIDDASEWWRPRLRVTTEPSPEWQEPLAMSHALAFSQDRFGGAFRATSRTASVIEANGRSTAEIDIHEWFSCMTAFPAVARRYSLANQQWSVEVPMIVGFDLQPHAPSAGSVPAHTTRYYELDFIVYFDGWTGQSPAFDIQGPVRVEYKPGGLPRDRFGNVDNEQMRRALQIRERAGFGLPAELR